MKITLKLYKEDIEFLIELLTDKDIRTANYTTHYCCWNLIKDLKSQIKKRKKLNPLKEGL